MANEKRVRLNFIEGTLGATLTAGSTTLTLAEAFPDEVATKVATTGHASLTIDPEGVGGDPEIVHVTAYTATETTCTVERGKEGTTAREHASGRAFMHAPTVRDFASGRVDWAQRTSGNVTVAGTNPAAVDIGTDLIVNASAGDVIEIMPNFRVSDANNNQLRVDFQTVVDGTLTNFLSSGTGTALGIGILGFFSIGGRTEIVTGSWLYRVQAGDIHEGTVTVRWMAWVDAGSRIIQATNSDRPARVQLVNHGPQEA